MGLNILMIEDDGDIAEMLIDYFAKYSIAITNYDDPYLGESALSIKRYDLLILDLSLPNIDGLELLQSIRKKGNNIPIIISSARSDIDDKIMGLRFGADDYLPKPYDPKELYARIISVMRRYNYKDENDKSLFRHDEIGCDIYFCNQRLNLTKAEYEILSYFIKHKDRAIGREELISNIFALKEGNPKSLEVIIGRIRHKLNDDTKNPTYLLSLRGIGYKLVG